MSPNPPGKASVVPAHRLNAIGVYVEQLSLNSLVTVCSASKRIMVLELKDRKKNEGATMKKLIIAVMLLVLSGCGMMPHGSNDNDTDRHSRTPMSNGSGGGNGGGGGY